MGLLPVDQRKQEDTCFIASMHFDFIQGAALILITLILNSVQFMNENVGYDVLDFVSC